MKTLAVIPLRSGSKRIKNKNVRIIDGLPLFYYILRTAKKVKGINEIIISTDSVEYKTLCETCDVRVILRDKKLSTDHTKSEEVVLDVLNQVDEDYDSVIMLQATNPLTDEKDLQKAIDLLENNPEVNSVSCHYKFNGFLTNDEDILTRPMTQDKKPKFVESGNFWLFRIKQFLEQKNRIIEPNISVEVSNISSIEIDTYEDLEIIEPLLIKSNRANNYFKKRQGGDRRSYDPDGIQRQTTQETDLKFDDVKEEVEFINSRSQKGLKLLDLGCGNGIVSSFISDDYEKFGLDPSSDIVNAKEHIKEDHLTNSYLNYYSYEENFFDVILCYHVIEHVEDPMSFIKLIKRILKDNGYLILSSPNYNSIVSKLFGENYRLLHDQTHISLFDDESMKFFLEDNGFYIFRKEFPFFGTRHFTKKNLDRLFDVSKMSPPFYGNIMTFYCLNRNSSN